MLIRYRHEHINIFSVVFCSFGSFFDCRDWVHSSDIYNLLQRMKYKCQHSEEIDGLTTISTATRGLDISGVSLSPSIITSNALVPTVYPQYEISDCDKPSKALIICNTRGRKMRRSGSTGCLELELCVTFLETFYEVEVSGNKVYWHIGWILFCFCVRKIHKSPHALNGFCSKRSLTVVSEGTPV